MTATVQEVVVAVAALAAGSAILWRVVRAVKPTSKSQPGCEHCAVGETAADDHDR